MSDPFYDMLIGPNRRALAMELLTQKLIPLIRKKYGIGGVPMGAPQAPPSELPILSLLETLPDETAHLVAIAFILYSEHAACDALEREHTGGIFGQNAGTHFALYMKRVRQFVDMTVRHPYDKMTIIEMLENFADAMRKEYVMGPLG